MVWESRPTFMMIKFIWDEGEFPAIMKGRTPEEMSFASLNSTMGGTDNAS